VATIFPGLSRTKVIFQDFPGPGILKKKIPGLSSRHGNPVNGTSEQKRPFGAMNGVHKI